MDSVTIATEGPTVDEFKHRELSPALANNDPSPPKKTNIRKRTKTGCMSMFQPPVLAAVADTLSANRYIYIYMLVVTDFDQPVGDDASSAMRGNQSVRIAPNQNDNVRATTRESSSRIPWVLSLEAPLGQYRITIRTRPKPSSTRRCLRLRPRRLCHKGLFQSLHQSPQVWTLQEQRHFTTLGLIPTSTEPTQRRHLWVWEYRTPSTSWVRCPMIHSLHSHPCG